MYASHPVSFETPGGKKGTDSVQTSAAAADEVGAAGSSTQAAAISARTAYDHVVAIVIAINCKW